VTTKCFTAHGCSIAYVFIKILKGITISGKMCCREENDIFFLYYFDMEVEAGSKLKEGLDRFGSFFSSPFFIESATGRELNAIEIENSKILRFHCLSRKYCTTREIGYITSSS
jgi:hypothetical protein